MRCGKIMYYDKDGADQDIIKILGTDKQRGKEPVPMRSYFCKSCKAWHTTRKKLRHLIKRKN